MNYYVIVNNNGMMGFVTFKDWARGNQALFPGYNFVDGPNSPTTNVIGNMLNQQGYTSIAQGDGIVVRFRSTELPR